METRNHGTAPIETDQFAEFAAAVTRQLPRHIHHDVVQMYIEQQGELKDLLNRTFELRIISKGTHIVMVDYGKSIEELKRLGEYKHESVSITSEQFPPPQKGVWKTWIELIKFSRPTVLEEANALLEQKDYQHINVYELLTLGVEHPELQLKSTIVALGSSLPDRDRGILFPDLGTDFRDNGRNLNLFDLQDGTFGGDEESGWCLAVRYKGAAIKEA